MNDSKYRHNVVRGGLWVGLGFVGQQGIAVLRTLILARLLTPEDFGLAGIVTLALFAGFMLTEWGVESALIQRAELLPRMLGTAWTLTILRGGGLFLVAQVTAPWIAAAFGRPDAELLLRVGAASFLLVNVPAVPAALLLRELRFRDRVALDAGRDVVGTVAAVALAIWLRNVWALLLGLLLGQMVAAVAVWFVHGFRPHWALDRVALADYWEFGRHLYASGLLAYVVTRGDDITVGKLRGVAELGQYQVVFGIAEMLTRGLSDVVSKVVFPAYSRITSEGRSLADAFDHVWRLHLLLLLPIASLLILFPTEFVALFLGSQWLPAAIPFAVLALAESLRAAAAACGTLILAGGKTAYLSRIKLAEVLCFSLLIVPMTARWGMTGAAGCLVLVYALSLIGHLWGAQRVEPAVIRLVGRSWEPIAATALLASLVWLLSPHAGPWPGVAPVVFTGLWAVYLWLRHAGFLIMLWGALRTQP